MRVLMLGQPLPSFMLGRPSLLVSGPAGGLFAHFVLSVAGVDGLAVLKFLQCALCSAYGVGGLVGGGNAHRVRVCGPLAGPRLVGVSVVGGFLSDVPGCRSG